MGRGKLNMELIPKDYSRWQTYQKRKKGLKKKALEFSTLCGVDTCIILYGPTHKGQPSQPEVWPESSPADVYRIIHKYKSKAFDSRAGRSFHLLDFFARRNKKIRGDISKLRKANTQSMFPTWHHSLDNLSLDDVKALLAKFDALLQVVRMKVMMINEQEAHDHQNNNKLLNINGGSTTSITNTTNPISTQRQKDDIFIKPQVAAAAVNTCSLKPYGSAMQMMPQFYPVDHQYQTSLYNQMMALQPVDHHHHHTHVNPLDYNQMMMMMMVMNGTDHHHFTSQLGCSTGTNNINNKVSYDSSSVNAMKDMMFSNQMVRQPPPLCVYEPSMQPVPTFGQCNMMGPGPAPGPVPGLRPSNLSQVVMGSQFSEFYRGIINNEDHDVKHDVGN